MIATDVPNVLAYKRQVAFGTLGSIVFSVLIIFANKFVFQNFDFRYIATLTSWHVLVTAGIMKVSVALGVITKQVR